MRELARLQGLLPDIVEGGAAARGWCRRRRRPRLQLRLRALAAAGVRRGRRSNCCAAVHVSSLSFYRQLPQRRPHPRHSAMALAHPLAAAALAALLSSASAAESLDAQNARCNLSCDGITFGRWAPVSFADKDVCDPAAGWVTPGNPFGPCPADGTATVINLETGDCFGPFETDGSWLQKTVGSSACCNLLTEPRCGGADAVWPEPEPEPEPDPQAFWMDCVGSLGDWSNCSLPCGGGTQMRSFVVSLAAARGGACEADGTTESQPCNTDACTLAPAPEPEPAPAPEPEPEPGCDPGNPFCDIFCENHPADDNCRCNVSCVGLSFDRFAPAPYHDGMVCDPVNLACGLDEWIAGYADHVSAHALRQNLISRAVSESLLVYSEPDQLGECAHKRSSPYNSTGHL